MFDQCASNKDCGRSAVAQGCSQEGAEFYFIGDRKSLSSVE
jgi:hypothetical protein